jgi:hypothetical protein
MFVPSRNDEIISNALRRFGMLGGISSLNNVMHQPSPTVEHLSLANSRLFSHKKISIFPKMPEFSRLSSPGLEPGIL